MLSGNLKRRMGREHPKSHSETYLLEDCSSSLNGAIVESAS